MALRFAPQSMVGLAVVVALHAAMLYALWGHRLIVPSPEARTLFVNFIAPQAPQRAIEPQRPRPPSPRPVERPRARQLVAQAPVHRTTDHVAQPPLADPGPEHSVQALPMPLPAGPVALSSELAVACPERPAPMYPPHSRRLGETGQVLLRVELSEAGRVALATVERSSGHARLDEAALAAVRNWRCIPARRNGQPARAVAVQPFRFVLHGS
ncbi:MAG: energy transducer TonB [Candidatus Accumulibacter sp.]|nr:energy transducer TonB [Accumulibacter sp.]MBN8455252.1 energy transducer TonB [Accumulibacter sp.]MBO3709627.1 energy transducer TonB [Accumulibacter sp.]